MARAGFKDAESVGHSLASTLAECFKGRPKALKCAKLAHRAASRPEARSDASCGHQAPR